MRTLFLSLALAVSTGACLQTAQADTPSAISAYIHPGDLSPATREAVAALGKMYDARDKLKACYVDYFYPVQDTVLVYVVGELQKPNKMNLRLFYKTTLVNEIVSDGVTETIYKASTKEYARFPAPRSYNVPHGYPTLGLSVEESKNEQKFSQALLLNDLPPAPPSPSGSLLSSVPLLFLDPMEAIFGATFLLRTTNPQEIAQLCIERDAIKLKRNTAIPVHFDIVDAKISDEEITNATINLDFVHFGIC